MTSVRDLLERFRPAATPGPAAPAGVPADRAAEAARELQPVFEALDDTLEECVVIRRQAEAAAAHRRDEASASAAALVADAETSAAAVREVERQRVLLDARDEGDAALHRARMQADVLVGHAASRLPAVVESVVAETRRLMAAAGSERGRP